MNAAPVSLGALLVAIVVSCTIRLHVGFLAIALAWITGVYVSGMSANEVMAGFPTRLFLTLAGLTLLFSQAQANGTLDRIAHQAVRYCRGNVGAMPMMFFVLAFVLASVGPGNIASTALVAPMAMAVAGQVRIPALPDGDHGWQWRERGVAVAHRPDGGDRQRRHGRHWP
jgi:di/tricarboxylate transporter